MKKIICALFALALALALAIPVFAVPLPMLVDDAGLLGASEAAALDKRLAALSEKYQCDTVVVTVDSAGDTAMGDYVDDFYMNSDYGQGENYDCFILLIDVENQSWILSPYGDVGAFTNAGMRFINERLREDLFEGDDAAALDGFVGWCERFYAQEATIGKPYDEGFLPPVDSAVPAVLSRDPDALSLLVDEASLLSAPEAAALQEKLEALSDKWQNDIVIVTVDSIGNADPVAFADDWFDYGGYGRGENYDGVLLLVFMDEDPPGGWLSTCGGAIDVFTDAGIKFISKQLRSNGLNSGGYAKAFNRFADLCDEFYAQAETGEPYDVGSLPMTSGDYFRIVLLSLAGGLGMAWIVTGGMKKKLKTVQKKQAAADYVRPGSLQVAYANEQFLYKNVIRKKKETSSSGGGGGSSTHSSSSGRSHGGGRI